MAENPEEILPAILKIFGKQKVRARESLAYDAVKSAFLQNPRFRDKDFEWGLNIAGVGGKYLVVEGTTITLTEVGADELIKMGFPRSQFY